jgi:hypothetical protein
MYPNPGREGLHLIGRSCIIVKTLIAISISVLLAASHFGVADSIADESPAALCSARVRQFVKEIDVQLGENRDPSIYFEDIIDKYLPAKGCNIDEIILIAKQSKFFWQAYDWGAGYTIGFRSARFEITFGLQKDTGNIEYPSAMPRPRSM